MDSKTTDFERGMDFMGLRHSINSVLESIKRGQDYNEVEGSITGRVIPLDSEVDELVGRVDQMYKLFEQYKTSETVRRVYDATLTSVREGLPLVHKPKIERYLPV